MIDQQFFTKQFQKSLIEETAARLGLPPASVEKDWWVCVVLEALYADSALHSLLWILALDPHDQDRQTVLVSYEALFSSIPRSITHGWITIL